MVLAGQWAMSTAYLSYCLGSTRRGTGVMRKCSLPTALCRPATVGGKLGKSGLA